MSDAKCRDAAAGLAGTMRAESHIETAGGGCFVAIGEMAAHVVKFNGKSLLRYQVKVVAESLSPHLRYADGSRTWVQEIEVSGRRERLLRRELRCGEAFIDQPIKITISYEAIGCKGTGAASMQLLLDSGALPVHDLELAAPYVVAIALYLISPQLTGGVKFAVAAAINQGRVGVPDVSDAEIPYYLTPDMIADYVEYAADAAQVLPAVLLPIVGAVYSFSSGIPAPVSVSFLLLACLAAIAMTIWLIKLPPSDYVSRKWSGYSVLSAAGIALNLVGMALALALS